MSRLRSRCDVFFFIYLSSEERNETTKIREESSGKRASVIKYFHSTSLQHGPSGYVRYILVFLFCAWSLEDKDAGIRDESIEDSAAKRK